MVIKTEKYVFGGSCIARVNGKTVFVPFAIPEEELKVEIIKEKRDYCEARITNVIVPSPHRKVPKCEYFSLCGGCDLQMIDDPEQHSLKFESARELLERAHINLDFQTDFVYGDDWQYRNRFQFHIHKNQLCFLGRKSNSFIPIKDCPIACKEVRKYLNTTPVFDDNEEGIRLHTFAYDGRLWFEDREKEVRLDILGNDFTFSPKSFFQSNVIMLKKLVSILKQYVGNPERMLDFYSGVGTFSIFFAKQVKELHLVEWNKYSIQMAEINLANSAHNAKCFFHCLNSEKWKDTQEAKLLYDVAIVDPPRSGIDKMSLSWFAKRKVKTLLYVSCNPATFVRDSSFLIMQGYTLQNCYFLDFYPQTHHLEVLGIFSL